MGHIGVTSSVLKQIEGPMRLIDADVLKQHIDKLPAPPDGNFAGNHSALKALINMQPTVQPEVIYCGECVHYDPPHVENEGVRYEYAEMPKEAFDVLGTGLVSVEYGINVGGRCCVDYYCKNYPDDKRVYVPKDNYCGRAERRIDG